MIKKFKDVDGLDVGLLLKLQNILLARNDNSGQALKENSLSDPMDLNGTLSGGTQIMSETEKFNKIIENQLNV